MQQNYICDNPLVRIRQLKDLTCSNGSCYRIVLRGHSRSTKSGCRCCDFTDGTVSFYLPQGKDSAGGMECMPCRDNESDGLAIEFSEELTKADGATSLQPQKYSFFRYLYKESLHISAKEKMQIERLMKDVGSELEWGFDKYTTSLIVNKLEELLTYCKRFYDRQFQIRGEACHCLMDKIKQLVDGQITANRSADLTEDSIETIAREMQMSAAYMEDYLLANTGNTTGEYIRKRQLELARKALVSGNTPIADIAASLGYSSARSLSIVFTKIYGCTPAEYRYATKACRCCCDRTKSAKG